MPEKIQIKGYLANLGMYTEGDICGKWVTFPMSKEEFTETLESIGVKAGVSGREEYIFLDWDSDIQYEDLASYFGCNAEYVNLANINDLCEDLAEAVDKYGKNAVLAAIKAFSIDDALSCDIVFVPEAEDEKSYGEYLVENGALEIPENILPYFDYEKYGREMSRDGTFTTYGYVELN